MVNVAQGGADKAGPVLGLRPKLPRWRNQTDWARRGPLSSRLRAQQLGTAWAWLARGPGLRGGWQASVCRLPLLRPQLLPLWAARLCMDRKLSVPEAGLKTDGRMRHCQKERAGMRLWADCSLVLPPKALWESPLRTKYMSPGQPTERLPCPIPASGLQRGPLPAPCHSREGRSRGTLSKRPCSGSEVLLKSPARGCSR